MALGRQRLGGSLSTGQLMRLSSQLCDRDDGLLSLSSVERMRDTESQKGGPLAVTAALRLEQYSGNLRGSGRPSSSSNSGQAAMRNTAMASMGNRIVSGLEPLSASRPSSSSRQDRGVSSCTKRENASQEQAKGKLDSSPPRKGGKGDQSLVQQDTSLLESPRAVQQQIESMAVEFNDEVLAMEHQIADLGKSMRWKDDNNGDAKAQEEREAEKRRREVELRKARLREKNARDPHKKIQLRLDNKRRFEMDTLDQQGIPTTKVSFEGIQRSERLVDVQALRTKCLGLSEGIHSVQKLVELKNRKETAVAHQSSTFGSPSLIMSSSMPTLGSLCQKDEISAKESSRWKDRYQKPGGHRQFPSSEKGFHSAKPMQTFS